MAADALVYFIELFKDWLGIFAAPARDFSLLWITVPIYLNWIFTEFYQEKKGTSLGNAISNGFIPLWVGVDWGKTTYQMLTAGTIQLDALFAVKMVFVVFMMLYGLIIIAFGIRAKRATKFIGRIREVSYVALMLTPLFYGTITLSIEVILSVVIFFPLFYFIVELLNRLMPTPKTYSEEGEGSSWDKNIKTQETSFNESAYPQQTYQQTYPQQTYSQDQYGQTYPATATSYNQPTDYLPETKKRGFFSRRKRR